jgi:hypothetical protein
VRSARGGQACVDGSRRRRFSPRGATCIDQAGQIALMKDGDFWPSFRADRRLRRKGMPWMDSGPLSAGKLLTCAASVRVGFGRFRRWLADSHSRSRLTNALILLRSPQMPNVQLNCQSLLRGVAFLAHQRAFGRSGRSGHSGKNLGDQRGGTNGGASGPASGATAPRLAASVRLGSPAAPRPAIVRRHGDCVFGPLLALGRLSLESLELETMNQATTLDDLTQRNVSLIAKISAPRPHTGGARRGFSYRLGRKLDLFDRAKRGPRPMDGD